MKESLRKTLQIAFATVSATLIQQKIRIANLESILLEKGIMSERDLPGLDLRKKTGIDEMLAEEFPELLHLPELFENV